MQPCPVGVSACRYLWEREGRVLKRGREGEREIELGREREPGKEMQTDKVIQKDVKKGEIRKHRCV